MVQHLLCTIMEGQQSTDNSTVESVKDEFVRSLRTIIALPAANRCESVAQGGAGHSLTPYITSDVGQCLPDIA